MSRKQTLTARRVTLGSINPGDTIIQDDPDLEVADLDPTYDQLTVVEVGSGYADLTNLTVEDESGETRTFRNVDRSLTVILVTKDN